MIRLRNKTGNVAQFVVKKGDQIIAQLPGIEDSAQMTIPTDETFEVIATAIIAGNTYISAPLKVNGSTGFLAQVLQVPGQGTYEFDVAEVPCKTPDSLEFQKTCLGSVTFTITKNGKPMQNVVVADDFSRQALDISDTFYVYAVVNGVTTGTSTFTSPTALITAVADTSDLENGYVNLVVS